MAEHSKYAPSSMSRLLSCPASFRETQAVEKEKSSIYAIRGTYKHDLFTQVWPHYVSGDSVALQTVFDNSVAGAKKLNLESWDEGDQQDVLHCCDYVKTILVTCGPNAVITLEQRVALDPWGIPDVWGTADVIIADPDSKRLIVADHKFGKGVPVFAEENNQLLTYLAGAAGADDVFQSFEVHVIQPPLDNYSSYGLNLKQLKEFVAKVKYGIELCNSPEATYNPTTGNCKFCSARNTCRERYKLAFREAKSVFKLAAKMPSVSNVEKAELARMLTNLEQVKKSLFADLQATILNGESVPGWKVVAGRSIRKWKDEGGAMKFLMTNNLVDEDKLFTNKFISPTQAEKLNRALKKLEGFKAHVFKPDGKPQLVVESDKRPDYDLAATAATAFKPLT